MKLKKLFWNWNNAIKTFPISHILLVAISAIWIWNIEGILSDHFSYRILIALSFTFLLSCLWPIIQIHSNLKNKNTINRILQISSLILWWIYYFILTKIKNIFDATYSEWLIYFWIILLAGLLIPLLIAILHRKEENKIWFSWTNLIVSLIFWWIAWNVVRGWIAWALWSIEALFDVNIISEWYEYIWVLSNILLAWSFVFNYYLTLVEDINQNKSEFKINPSRIRRIFWSFIFLPLALIYLLIFWAYWVKILVTWIWPRWIIVWLWIGYFALWVISLYMNYPDKTKTHEIINKILYISFILIALMMIWAIYQRIDQYWITINRCFICYIIIFIIIFSALSLIFKNKRLLSFVSTLFILTLLAIYWPINANNISFKSQTNRLTTLLSKENISLPLSEWALENVNKEQARLILWALDELAENYSPKKIINKIISYDYSGEHRYSTRSKIREYLKVNEEYEYYYDNDYSYFSYWQYSDYGEKWIDVSEFSKFYQFGLYDDVKNQKIHLVVDGKTYNVDISEYIDELIEKANYENEDRDDPALVLEWEDYKLTITWYSWRKWYDEEPYFTSMEWYILIK